MTFDTNDIPVGLVTLAAIGVAGIFFSCGARLQTDADAVCVRQYQAATTRADTLTIALNDQSCKALLEAVERGNK